MIKSFVVAALVAVVAPVAIEGPDFDDSLSAEEGPPLEKSSSGEDPEDQSSKDSSDEDGPPTEDEALDPYDPERVRKEWRKRYPRIQHLHVNVPEGVVIFLAHEARKNDGPE